jgi:hypothetical protein
VETLDGLDSKTRELANEIVKTYRNYADEREFSILKTAVREGHPELVYLAIEHLFGYDLMGLGAKALGDLKTKANAEWLIDRFGYECVFASSSWNEFALPAALLEFEKSICKVLDLKLDLERDKRVPLEVFREALGPPTHEGVSPTEAKRLRMVALLETVNGPKSTPKIPLQQPAKPQPEAIPEGNAWWKWLLAGMGLLLPLQLLWRKKSA